MVGQNDIHDVQLLPDAPSNDVPSELVHSLMRLLQIARYRKTTIIQSMCVAIMCGAVYYALAPRYYDSTAKLLIDRRNQDQVATMTDQPALDSTMATHREIVVSPVVIQNAAQLLLPEHQVDFQNKAPSDWARSIARRLSARTTRKANFIEVRYRSKSPEAASAVVSAVIQSYLEFVESTHKGASSDAIAVLTNRSNELDRSLNAKKAELLAYRDRVGSLAVNEESGVIDPTLQRALRLNETLLDAQQRKLKLEASYSSIQRAMQKGEDLQQHLLGLEEVVGRQMLISALGLTPQDLQLIKDQQQKGIDARAELTKVEQFYGPSHPKVVELQERVRAIDQYLSTYRAHTGERMASFGGSDLGPMLVKMLEQSVEQAQEQERQLQVAYESERQKARSQSDDLQRMQDIERDIKRLEVERDTLVGKIATIDTNQLQAPIQATVVQEPLPDDWPDSPRLQMVVLLTLMTGFCFGAAVAYVQDVLDDRFASPEEMSKQLAVPVLSMIRRLDPIDAEGLFKVHTFVSPNAVEAESFRTLRTALTLASAATDRIAVSSAEPGDGKTTVTANLAVSFAQAGKRTIVIDADLRKPGMTGLLGLKGTPGVSDVLCGHEQVATAAAAHTHRTDHENLDILPAGLRRPNPAELLGGQAFVELLGWAEANYDQVIVDCPPVLAVSDAQIIGRLVDGVILVVQPHKNHRRLVARACHSFAATGTSVLGVVANCLSPQTSGDYGYGHGYGYGYGYGHDGESKESVSTDRRTTAKTDDREILPMSSSVESGLDIENPADSEQRRSRRTNRAA